MDEAVSYLIEGNKLYYQGEYEAAIEKYDYASKLRPTYSFIYEAKARSLREMCCYDEALINFNKAITCLNSDSPELFKPRVYRLYYCRGDVLFNLERYGESLHSFKRALLEYSHEGDVDVPFLNDCVNEGLYFKRMGLHKHAIDIFQLVYDIGKDHLQELDYDIVRILKNLEVN